MLITRPQVAETFARTAPRAPLAAIDEVFVTGTHRNPALIYHALPQLRVALKQGITQGKEEMVA